VRQAVPDHTNIELRSRDGRFQDGDWKVLAVGFEEPAWRGEQQIGAGQGPGHPGEAVRAVDDVRFLAGSSSRLEVTLQRDERVLGLEKARTGEAPARERMPLATADREFVFEELGLKKSLPEDRGRSPHKPCRRTEKVSDIGGNMD